MTKKWEFIGNVAVDSGQVILVDPCYVLNDYSDYTYDDLIIYLQENNYQSDADEIVFSRPNGTGVRVKSGLGDGLYPAYIKKDSEGVIEELKIKFMP